VVLFAITWMGNTAPRYLMYSVSQKSSPPKTFCNIFTQAKYISVKFCGFVTRPVYIHT